VSTCTGNQIDLLDEGNVRRVKFQGSKYKSQRSRALKKALLLVCMDALRNATRT
jgi:hypothetical protein